MTPETAEREPRNTGRDKTKEIELEATKVLRAEHTQVSFTDMSWVSIVGGDGCLLQVGHSHESSPRPTQYRSIAATVRLNSNKVDNEKTISAAQFDTNVLLKPVPVYHAWKSLQGPTLKYRACSVQKQ